MSNKIRQRRRFKWLFITGIILGVIVLAWTVIYFLPVSKNGALHQFDRKKPLIIAHAGGADLAPANTLVAFENASEIGADVLEFDIHMTRDGHLVSIHDVSVDRTTDGTGDVNDMTLEEIQALDAGYRFEDLDGEYSYRDEGVQIPTVDEVFEAFSDTGMLFNVEIKDTNDPNLFNEMAEKLWSLIKEYDLEEKVITVSFDQEIVNIMLDVSSGHALVAGGRGEITKFVVLHKLFLNGLYAQHVNALQIPTSDSGINLKDRKIIRGAQKRGMQTHYWTIDDKKTMQELIDLGADGIMTDRPDLLVELLDDSSE